MHEIIFIKLYIKWYLYNHVISWLQPNKKFRLKSICNPTIVIIMFYLRRVVLASQTNSRVGLSSILFQKKKLHTFYAH